MTPPSRGTTVRIVVDRKAAARAIEDFLRALGHAPEGDLAGTGQRVADAWADDLLAGEPVDAAALLSDGAVACEGSGGGLVLLRDIAVATMCPHHLLPAIGSANVAYLPGRRIAGLGRIAHVVDVLSRRLTLQEHIGTAVADLLVDELGAVGALCHLRLTHTCLVARGERQAGALVETIALAGSFTEPGPDRELALTTLRSRP